MNQFKTKFLIFSNIYKDHSIRNYIGIYVNSDILYNKVFPYFERRIPTNREQFEDNLAVRKMFDI